MKYGSLIHRLVRGDKIARPPFWFMRQAGRYLPEYRELRAETKDFLSLCYNPQKAAEVTLQPIRRFNMDAAIVFSDILVVPHAMGVNVRFEQGEGPKLSPVNTRKLIDALTCEVETHLQPVAETIQRTRQALAEEKALIGFCGAPWTVACYMVEGSGSRDFETVRKFARSETENFQALIDKIIEASVCYLCLQVKAGADVLQIFDSWAGVLPEEDYRQWVINPTQTLVSRLKALHPDVPVIGFPRGSGAGYETYAAETGVDVVSVDMQTPLAWAKKNILKPLQGNLDPIVLATDRHAAVQATRQIIKSWNGKPFIFNLGHGMVPYTPLENVQAVCDVICEVNS